MGVLNELKNRGLRDTLTAAADGLTGFPEAINAVFPDTEVQLCMVHMVRNAVKYVSYKDRKAVTADLKEIYLAPSADAALGALERFGEKWDAKYPAVSKSSSEPVERGHSLSEVFPGDTAGNIYDQRDRVGELYAAREDENPAVIPER
jgi:transposase-like protein